MQLPLFIILIFLGWAIASPASGEPPVRQRAARINAGWPVDDFTLTDQHGRPFTRARLRGRWTLVLFGDTQCGEPCAAALSALEKMSQRISPTTKLKTTQILFVSLNGDTPEMLARYLAFFDARFVGVSGPSATVARLADDLGLFETVPAPSDGRLASDEPRVLALVDPDAVVWGQFLPPFDALMLTARYLKTRVGR